MIRGATVRLKLPGYLTQTTTGEEKKTTTQRTRKQEGTINRTRATESDTRRAMTAEHHQGKQPSRTTNRPPLLLLSTLLCAGRLSAKSASVAGWVEKTEKAAQTSVAWLS